MGTFTLSQTVTLPRIWYKPWTWRTRTVTRRSQPIAYDATPHAVQRETARLLSVAPEHIDVAPGRGGTHTISFGVYAPRERIPPARCVYVPPHRGR